MANRAIRGFTRGPTCDGVNISGLVLSVLFVSAGLGIALSGASKSLALSAATEGGSPTQGSLPVLGVRAPSGPAAQVAPPGPSARAAHVMAYDSESDRIVLFGGRLPGFVASDETWAYDLATNEWTQMNPATRPPARFGHAMVYVPGLDQIVLFGGFGGDNFFGDTWAYHLEANRWTPISPPSATPTPRAGSAMAYDGGSGKVVLFGGRADVFNNETWVYDPQASTWTMMSPVTAPSIRERHRMVYASASDRIVLFGGNDPAGILSGETWSYHFDLDSWTKMNPAAAPSPRHGHSMAYDEESDRAILFSGDSGVQSGDTWSYNLGTNLWESLSPPVGPLGRVLHSLAYDIESDRMVLFGGEWPFLGVPNGETWAYDYDANIWIPLDQKSRPSARGYHAMAYDSESDRVILLGGSTRGGGNGETWMYDANTNTWMKHSPSTSPSPRDSHAMAYDEESDVVILFGGFTATGPSSETWAYDLNTDTWTNMVQAASPSPRYAMRMVYDSLMDRVILFGGEDGAGGFLGDTWSYDYNSNTWTLLTTVGAPPPRGFQAMAYDVESNLVVMYGGNGNPIRGDTWTFHTGTATWAQVTPATSPSARGWCGGTYDAGGDRFIIFGGNTGPTETWAFNANANTWFQVATSSGPSERHEHAMVYDGESNRLVLFGGMWPFGLVTDPGIVRNRETWIFDGGNGTWTMVDGPDPPMASFTFSPETPVAGGTVTFDASVSTDPDGSITSSDWTFGDGGSLTGVTVAHVYSAAGTYTATLTVQDDDGLTNVTSRPLVIAPAPDTTPPSVTITSPANGAALQSTVADVTGTASDNVAVEKVELSLDGTDWIVAGGTTSWSGTLTLVEGPNTIYARATDSSGNNETTSVTVTVKPPAPPPPIDPLIVAIVAVAVVGAAVAAFIAIRRRRKAP